jgi:hypothetical protein
VIRAELAAVAREVPWALRAVALVLAAGFALLGLAVLVYAVTLVL